MAWTSTSSRSATALLRVLSGLLLAGLGVLAGCAGGSPATPDASMSVTAASFTQAVGGTSAAQTMTLSNTGSGTLTVSSVAISGTNATAFSQTNTCGTSVAAGANCTIAVTFTPSAAATYAATLAVTDNATGSPHTVALSGTGTAPAVTLTAAALSFNQLVGSTSAAQTVTLTNAGTAALAISGIGVSGTNAASFGATNTCGSSVAAGASCAIAVTFAPTATGAAAALISIADNAAGTPQTIALTGTGTAPAVTLSGSTLSFTQAVGGTSAAQLVTLTNSGTAALTVSGITLSGANAAAFAQTNTCGMSVAVGGSCAISVSFTPSATGSAAATIGVADSAAGSPQTIALSGTGTAPALTLSNSALSFTQQAGAASAAQTVTLTNSGTAPLTFSGITLGGANAGSFAETSTCGATLAVGATCSLAVTFTPAATGSFVATLTIADNVAGAPQTIALSGTGTAPAVTLSAAALSFTQLVGGTSAAQTITLTNSGTAPLTISGIALGGANAASFAQTTTCGPTIAVGGSCTIAVTFSPTASGAAAATVSIADNASGAPQTIALTGTGTAPVVTLSANSLSFTQLVNTTGGQTVTVTNSGTASLTISGITLGGANASLFTEQTTCGTTLAAGASCTISVTFTPTATGAATAAVSLADSAGGSPQTIALSGTGTAPAVTLSASSLSFSQVLGAAGAAQTVTLTNSGTGLLALSNIALSGTNALNFTTTNTCGPTVAVNGTCSLSVTFSPSATGSYAATLIISDTASGGSQTIALTGTATGPIATYSTSSLTFSQPAGTTSAAQTVTLNNTGTTAMTVSSIALGGANAGLFTQTNTCGGAVAAGASCVISVTFAPTAGGSFAATITVTDNASLTPQTVVLTGTGTAPALTIAPAILSFSTPQNSASAAQVVTLTNSGTAVVTLKTINVTGTNAATFTFTTTCTPNLAIGGSCAISIIFTPATTGSFTATLNIGDNVAGSPQTVALAGSTPVLGTVATMNDSYTYTFTNAASGLVLGISGQSQTAGASLVQEANTGSQDSLWHFMPMNSNEYNIENMLTHQVLGISGASTAAGAQALQWADSGTADHLWQLSVLADGNYLIKNINSNLFLEDAGSDPTTAAVIDQGTRVGAGCTCQEWILTSTGNSPYPNPETVKVNYTAGDYDTIHDPSMIKIGSTYYLYGTHSLLHAHVSPDRVNFTDNGVALSGLPAWTNTYDGSDSDLWAPDASMHNGQYWLYYAASTFGSANSAIGLATSATGVPGTYVDSGTAVYTSANCPGSNAIDPASVVDFSGNAWMVFGSWSNGIHIVPVNNATGIPTGASCTLIAARPNGLEGTFIYKHGSYYYLFGSIDVCCSGDTSTYRITVGRSTSITGPYTDRGGLAMTSGGGTILLSAHGTFNGPGGQSLFADTDGDILVYHYYDGNNNGASALGINHILWTSDGWPYVSQ